KALFPRTYIDPNRTERDIAEDMRPNDWPHATAPTIRSTAGHGLIRQTIGDKIPVYDRTLMTQEINHRLTHYYRPYHAALENLLENTLQTHGLYFHINCHSTPPSAMRPYYTGPLPDFVLGDKDGTSCGIIFRRSLQSFLIGLGYRVSVNLPFKGVEIVRRYGEPSRGKHSLQIEINKDLYLTPENKIMEKRFNKLKDDLQKLIHHLNALAASYSTPQAAD
ncbi:MAG TPA: N-formylglutamate amidohydrolase, partial [Alphaproteobacteria bacterium]|nr:N-formylglutamate amidohydrolase [Alphaproteobacteria bacterium]